jgi:hypothetical protein
MSQTAETLCVISPKIFIKYYGSILSKEWISDKNILKGSDVWQGKQLPQKRQHL